MGTSLNGKNWLQERANSFHKRAVPYGMEKNFYCIMCPPLNVTIFITHVHNCVMETTPMVAYSVEPLSAHQQLKRQTFK